MWIPEEPLRAVAPAELKKPFWFGKRFDLTLMVWSKGSILIFGLDSIDHLISC